MLTELVQLIVSRLRLLIDVESGRLIAQPTSNDLLLRGCYRNAASGAFARFARRGRGAHDEELRGCRTSEEREAK
jgi:hypothetical protein